MAVNPLQTSGSDRGNGVLDPGARTVRFSVGSRRACEAGCHWPIARAFLGTQLSTRVGASGFAGSHQVPHATALKLNYRTARGQRHQGVHKAVDQAVHRAHIPNRHHASACSQTGTLPCWSLLGCGIWQGPTACCIRTNLQAARYAMQSEGCSASLECSTGGRVDVEAPSPPPGLPLRAAGIRLHAFGRPSVLDQFIVHV